MTAPSALETTPLTGSDLQWWEMYAEARKTLRWETFTFDDAASSRPMLWPQMPRIYDGMALAEPEPEPEPERTFLQRLKARFS
jgi:hypothetical protein